MLDVVQTQYKKGVALIRRQHEETSRLVKSVQERTKTIENHQSQAANYIGIVQKSSYNKYNSSVNAANKPPNFFEV